MTRWRPTVAEIDLGAIRHNVAVLSRCTGASVESMAVVKANAYGHGDVEVARACVDAGVGRLAVALVEEGVRLRDAGIDAPILLLVEAVPDAAKEIVVQRLTPSVSTREGAEALSEAAAVASATVPVHVCVDTGMHREGASTLDAVDLTIYAAGLPGLEVEGLWSHLAVADEDNHPQTKRQVDRFADVCGAVKRAGVEVRFRHLANSAGIIAHPDAHFDVVRMGVSMYGLPPSPWLRGRADLRPAMSVRSAVGAVRRVPAGEGISYGLVYAPARDATIATVPIGYADGYARSLTDGGEMLLRGARRRVAGRVTMDQTMIDCGADDVAVGDEVVVIGEQGSQQITADEIADRVGTISYEIISSIGPRVPREYRR